MSIFNNFSVVNDEIKFNKYVKWIHAGIPDEPEWWRYIMRIFALLMKHCTNCTALSGCYFVDSNLPKSVAPNSDGLLHDNCHCFLENAYLTQSDITAYCPLEKFTEYIWGSQYKDNGKRWLFEDWGFSKNDALQLKHEYESQAEQKYYCGQYLLDKLDFYGQNINITISLNTKKGIKEIISGWKVHPLGYITCNTPFGGKI